MSLQSPTVVAPGVAPALPTPPTVDLYGHGARACEAAWDAYSDSLVAALGLNTPSASGITVMPGADWPAHRGTEEAITQALVDALADDTLWADLQRALLSGCGPATATFYAHRRLAVRVLRGREIKPDIVLDGTAYARDSGCAGLPTVFLIENKHLAEFNYPLAPRLFLTEPDKPWTRRDVFGDVADGVHCAPDGTRVHHPILPSCSGGHAHTGSPQGRAADGTALHAGSGCQLDLYIAYARGWLAAAGLTDLAGHRDLRVRGILLDMYNRSVRDVDASYRTWSPGLATRDCWDTVSYGPVTEVLAQHWARLRHVPATDTHTVAAHALSRLLYSGRA